MDAFIPTSKKQKSICRILSLVQPNVTILPQKLDEIDGKVNAVGKSVEKKIDMISTYLIRYLSNNYASCNLDGILK